MDINLLNKQKVDEWLSQFKNEDRPKALSLIDDINFIDQLDYDRYTSNIVDKIIQLSTNFDNVYLIPINSLSEKSEPKSDSAFTFNIKKKLPQNIDPIWHFKGSQKNKKIKRNSIIFFIDEFSGSGNTFLQNIKGLKQYKIDDIENNILARIRSLSSFKVIEVHILTIVIYKQAITLLKNNFKFKNYILMLY